MDPQSKPLFFCSYPIALPYPNFDWTLEENAIFENSLGILDHDSPDFFENIASRIPGKSVEQVEQHFNRLKKNAEMILSGKIKLPKFNTTSAEQGNRSATPIVENKPLHLSLQWTEEDDKLLLEDLERFDEGDCVVTNTPARVASRAQKHFVEQDANSASQPEKHSTSKDASTSTSMATTPPPISLDPELLSP